MRAGSVIMLTLVCACVCACGRGTKTADVQDALRQLQPGESTTVNGVTFTLRQRATAKPNMDGWCSVTSAGSGFVVRMPVSFSDVTAVTQATDGTAVTTHHVGGRGSEGAQFNAMCTRRGDGVAAIDWPKRVIEPIAVGALDAKLLPTSQGQFTGSELSMTSTRGSRFLGRFLVGEGWMCQVSAEYPSSREDLADVAREFLDSFRPPPGA